MPMLQFQCCGEIEEEFLHPSEAKTKRPVCPECGKLMDQIFAGAPAVVWARPMSYYNDKKLAGADLDSHVAYKVRSTTRKDGRPEPVVIDSFAKQKQFCKEVGLGVAIGSRQSRRNPLRLEAWNQIMPTPSLLYPPSLDPSYGSANGYTKNYLHDISEWEESAFEEAKRVVNNLTHSCLKTSGVINYLQGQFWDRQTPTTT